MQLYALVHNNRITVGPRSWSRSFFLEYLEDEDLDTSGLPRSNPGEAIITETWKILPVSEITYPEMSETFEQLVGPFWTIHKDHITGIYNKTDKKLDVIKSDLKNVVASNRYNVEVGKLEYTFSDGQVVQLYTDRDGRMIYLDTLHALPDGMTVPFKFHGGVFRTAVTKQELHEIVRLGAIHIATAFGWEAQKVAEIENAKTIEELKNIELRHPYQMAEELKDGSTAD